MNTTPDLAAVDALSAERTRLVRFLGRLAPEQWDATSRCNGWTIHHVAAHLASAPHETVWDFTKGMIRHLGRFDAMTAESAVAYASAYAPDELIEQIASSAGSSDTPFGGSVPDSLVDVIVHSQDIARPLGGEPDLRHDPGHVNLALDHAITSRWYGAKKRFRHLRLVASDHDWTAGDGPDVVEGPMIELLMVATGRGSDTDRLKGSGVDLLRSRL